MRPYVFVNIASSLDGKISDETRKQVRISCKEDLRRVDELRASADAIMVGIGTILSDNPKLNVKSEELRKKRILEGKEENPIKVVVDSRCRIPENAEVFNSKVILAVSKLADKEKVERINKKAEVVAFGEEKVDLKALLEYLYKKGVRKLMVEGGGTLISSLLREDLVDEMFIYYAPIIIGGEKSPTICDGNSFNPALRMKIVSVERFGEGVLLRITRSDSNMSIQNKKP
ncbi:MAG: 2,5-diamino-6-(ribosylamino)-4(3H)-pyrimidinone 5'-phosphate reductase [Archaeoglobaceae archaeon]|nr:2,5-diamino-6-(ribosylamino)-4(3H)-pyrimidinone 5'-phosphate reductase [Archaeoglobaceae archaeon]MDW8128750.1 2,5-diamino-6-(ribosylamino)-4(3H)-pyrimidinone 5'-phosphate reductase [Archaeoglobaceae archaeon]